MLKNNKYYYEDYFMYFTFDGVHSSIYNLFIKNSNGHKMENGVNESSEFISAMFQEGSYYLGTSKTQKTITRECAAEGLTLSQYKAMMKWLTVGKTGFLVFDSNPYWGWTVVLDSVGDTTYSQSSEGLIVEFELTFKTIGSYLARNSYPAYYDTDWSSTDATTGTSSCNGFYNESCGSNEYGIPVVYMNKEEPTKIHILGINNEHQHLDIACNCQLNQDSNYVFTVNYEGQNYVASQLKPGTDKVLLEWHGESNLVMLDKNIIELHDKMYSNYQAYGTLLLPSTVPLRTKIVQFNQGNLSITLEAQNDLNLGIYNCICLVKQNQLEGNAAEYGESLWNFNGYGNIYTTHFIPTDIIDLSSLLITSAITITDSEQAAIVTHEVEGSNATIAVVLGSASVQLPDDLTGYTCYLCYYNTITVERASTDKLLISATSCSNL